MDYVAGKGTTAMSIIVTVLGGAAVAGLVRRGIAADARQLIQAAAHDHNQLADVFETGGFIVHIREILRDRAHRYAGFIGQLLLGKIAGFLQPSQIFAYFL